MAKIVTWAQLINMYGKQTELLWVKRDTRWDVYPCQEPTQLAAHNWEGWWLPLPDGTWFKAPTSFVTQCQAYTPDLHGIWVDGGGLQQFHRWERNKHDACQDCGKQFRNFVDAGNHQTPLDRCPGVRS